MCVCVCVSHVSPWCCSCQICAVNWTNVVLQCRVDFSLCRRKEPDDLRETSCVCNHLELFLPLSLSLSSHLLTHTHTHTHHTTRTHTHTLSLLSYWWLCCSLSTLKADARSHTHTHCWLSFRLQASGRATGRRQCGFQGLKVRDNSADDSTQALHLHKPRAPVHRVNGQAEWPELCCCGTFANAFTHIHFCFYTNTFCFFLTWWMLNVKWGFDALIKL